MAGGTIAAQLPRCQCGAGQRLQKRATLSHVFQSNQMNVLYLWVTHVLDVSILMKLQCCSLLTCCMSPYTALLLSS